MCFIQHCSTCRPSDSTVSEDAGIEPRTLATSALAVKRSSHSAISHPQVGYISSTARLYHIRLSDYHYNFFLLLNYRKIEYRNGEFKRNYRTIVYRIKASIYRIIRYRTQKKLSVAHLCKQVIERGVAATSTI
jgi:hypothetical protein